jgi:hypothetical protein
LLSSTIVRFVPFALAVSCASACGPGLLTPEVVRENLSAPKGAVVEGTIGRTARDFFQAKRTSGAQSTAFFLKSSESGDDGASNWANGVVQQGAMEDAVRLGVLDDVGDLFCAADLVANIARFGACESETKCDVELTIDSCVLRIGAGGDESARGKIKFKLKNSEETNLTRSELRLTFEGFEHKGLELVEYLEGILALETTQFTDKDRVEVILSSDLEQQSRTVERGFFDDGIVARSHLASALRFTAEGDEDRANGKLEILAFVDEDGGRDESVVLELAANSEQLSDDASLAQATLAVRGSNGSFHCTWNGAGEELTKDTATYTSNGSCLDDATGERFSFNNTLTER